MDYAIVPRQALIDEAEAAWQAGRAMESCPYVHGTDHAKVWCAGFRIAPAVVGIRETKAYMRKRGWL